MNDLEAIAAARSYLKQVFVDENITDISLEEIEQSWQRGTSPR